MLVEAKHFRFWLDGVMPTIGKIKWRLSQDRENRKAGKART